MDTTDLQVSRLVDYLFLLSIPSMHSSLICIIFWNSRNLHLGGTHFDTDEKVGEAVLYFWRGQAGD